MTALVYGGSGSGKSAFAESLAAGLGRPGGELVYIATMPPHGPEAAQRIARHQAQRAEKGFTTVECGRDIGTVVLPSHCVVLVECLGTLTANEMFGPNPAENVCSNILGGLEELAAKSHRLVIVSNDIFADGQTYDRNTERYRRTLAALHRELARTCSLVAEVVCGLPLWHVRQPKELFRGWRL